MLNGQRIEKMSKKPDRVQYKTTQFGQQMTGYVYPHKFKVMCPYCKCETVCAKRHIKIVIYNNFLYDAVDMFVIDPNWYSQNVQGRCKKYYCCARCYKFLLGKGGKNTNWIDRFLIADYDVLTKCHKVIDKRPKTAMAAKTAQEASKIVFAKDIRVVNSEKPPTQPVTQPAKKKKKKSKGGTPQQPAQSKKDKDKSAKWGQCPICHGSVKRNGRRDKNNKRYNVIANHFSGNRQCGGSELDWETVIVSNHKREKYKVTIEEVTDGKL